NCCVRGRMSESTTSPARLHDLIRSGRIAEAHRPWPRAVVDAAHWGQATALLAAGQWTLLGLWGEADHVHLALDDGHGEIGVLSLACPDQRFPSVGQKHPPAIRLERTLRDLWSLEPEGLQDDRPWLDHGKWHR